MAGEVVLCVGVEEPDKQVRRRKKNIGADSFGRERLGRVIFAGMQGLGERKGRGLTQPDAKRNVLEKQRSVLNTSSPVQVHVNL